MSDQPLRSAVQDASTGIFALAPDGAIESWNEGAARIFGYSEDEVHGEQFSKYIVERDAVSRLLDEARDNGQSEDEHRCLRKDGSQCWIRTVITAVEENGTLCGFLATITEVTEREEHEERERQNRYQREELVTLNRIHRLIEELIQRLVTSERLEDLEATVCERLSDAPFYTNAWIGERSADGKLVHRAGTEDEDYIQMIAGLEPAVVAEAPISDVFDDGEIFVTRQMDTDERIPEPVKRAARERGYKSVIILPIQYGETTYGVLVVHSSRDYPFGEHEQTALETLAKTIGFAIYALKQERLLLADEVVELEFEVAGSNAVFATLAIRNDCRCRVDDIVQGFEGEFYQFLSIDGTTPEQIRETLANLETVEEYRITSQNESFRLEVQVTPEDFLNRVIETGTDVRTVIATHDSCRLVLETVPENIDDLERLVEQAFSQWTLTRKKTVEKSTRTAETEDHPLEELLTEKQLIALRTAYMTGYFDHPRKSTAEEIADDLNITGVTLFQHLQAAQRKLIEACLY